MADTALINKAKLALRISTDAFDTQISDLLDASFQDMGIAGVVVPETLTAIVEMAAITYTAMHFGAPDEFDRLKRSYDEQKGQLATASGYTDWGDIDG
jgi:hypothetical protein